MDNRSEVRDFLTSRRAKLTPEQAGLPLYGGNRRVTGLRREEVAMLAGVSADYYIKLERGYIAGVSHSVLEAVAAALQLDEAERNHLHNLASTANSQPTQATGRRARSASAKGGVRPGIQLVLDNIVSAPAYVRNGRMDILATNHLGRALFADALAGGQALNLARYLFLDDRSHEFYADWETVARDNVRSLRVEVGRNPYDRTLSDLIGELATRSNDFAVWWGTHDVKLHSTATKHIHHGVCGALTVTGEALTFPGDQGLTMVTYTVEPASPSSEALAFLASWADQTLTDSPGPTGTPRQTRS